MQRDGRTNFVFDMGGVLMDFDAARLASRGVDSPEDAELIRRALYASPSWALLDAGAISESTMEEIAMARLPERLWEAMLDGFSDWERHVPAFPEMNEEVARLHEQRYGCYLLSNAGTRWWRMKEYIPAMAVMDGFVVSAFERVMKPDPMIYTILCERYRIDPTTCVFVDDNADNCRGAERCGMRSYHYDGDARSFASWAEAVASRGSD